MIDLDTLLHVDLELNILCNLPCDRVIRLYCVRLYAYDLIRAMNATHLLRCLFQRQRTSGFENTGIVSQKPFDKSRVTISSSFSSPHSASSPAPPPSASPHHQSYAPSAVPTYLPEP